MSWWVRLKDRKTGEVVQIPPHSEGGTHVVGGTTDAELNITYNYGGHFHDAGLLFGRSSVDKDDTVAVHGKSAADLTPLLEAAVNKLGVVLDDDYWKPTPGNAGHALSVLLGWARQHPTAVFEVH